MYSGFYFINTLILEMKYLVLAFTILMAFIYCKQKNNAVENTRTLPEKIDTLFPVHDILVSQVKLVDSLQLPTVAYINTNGKKDTMAVSINEFKKYAKDFTDIDFTSPAIIYQYRESSFADQSINSITLTYEAKNKTLPAQRVDVIIQPNPVADDVVKSIYIEKYETLHDTLVEKKLYWKINSNFQVISNSQFKNAHPVLQQTKISWDGN
jgi:hypothetical protein